MSFDYASKIQSLLARADHPNTPEAEATSCRAMAEKLMRTYRIEQEHLLATDPGAAAPIFKNVRVTTYVTFSSRDLERYYTQVMRDIVRHAGCLIKMEWDEGYVATICGYEGDVRYAEYLWTAALLMFTTRIDPVWDSELPETENIWRLRNAGLERRVIADQAWGRGAGQLAANRSKVQRIYVKECAAKGEPVRAAGLGYKTDAYREAYAESFAEELAYRLRMARFAADKEGGALVMHGREDRIREAMWARFPDMRPQPPKAAPDGAQPVYMPCARCASNPSGTCRDHPYKAVTVAMERRWRARENSSSAAAGRSSGRDAAARVDVVRGTSGTRTGRVGGQDAPRSIEG
jgi:hypothetical protein